jgi:hypothetical protein
MQTLQPRPKTPQLIEQLAAFLGKDRLLLHSISKGNLTPLLRVIIR